MWLYEACLGFRAACLWVFGVQANTEIPAIHHLKKGISLLYRTEVHTGTTFSGFRV